MATSILTRFERGVRDKKTHLASFIDEALSEVSPLVTATMIAIPVVMAALFFVWTHVGGVRYGYEISRAGEMHRALGEENRALRVEVASLKDPKRLAELATTRYGLAAPKASQIVKRGIR